jgi:hypothetical protein
LDEAERAQRQTPEQATPLHAINSRQHTRPLDEPETAMAIVMSRATFLHIPKCGGTWAIKAISAAGLTYEILPADDQHRIAGTENRFVFTFVRHPLSWYASFWNFRWKVAEGSGRPIAEQLRGDAHRCDEKIDACLVDDHGRPRLFTEFVVACIARFPGFLSEKYELYTSKCHFVGRQESLCADLLTALERSGTQFDARVIAATPRENESSPKFVARYPRALADAVLKSEGAAVETYYAGVEETRLITSSGWRAPLAA